MTVLVTFATSLGATRGIAERIATRLQGRGIAAEALPVSGQLDVASYDAVVLGSAIHTGAWLPAAARFVDANLQLLSRRPVWLFSVSTLGDEETMVGPRATKVFRSMREESKQVIHLRDLVGAKGHRNFAGLVARSDWPLVGRAFFKAIGGRYGDHRNWPAIDAWADDIAAALTAEAPALSGSAPRR